MTIRELWYGCWLSHGDTIWEATTMRCLQCGTVIPVLPQKAIIGPAHQPEPCRGQATGKAVRESKLTRIRRA